MGILYIRDSEGKFIQIPAIPGESAYEIAVKKGVFSGTEQEFAEMQVFDNKNILDQITQEDIDNWNSGGGGSGNNGSGMTDEEREQLAQKFDDVQITDTNELIFYSNNREIDRIQLEGGMTEEEREQLNDKFDNVEVNEEESNDKQTALNFFSNGRLMKTIYFTGGSGGGGSTSAYISSTTSENLMVNVGENFDLAIDFNSPNLGRGTLKIAINDIDVMSTSIIQGENIITVSSEHLIKGTNRMTVYVLDRVGQMSNSLTFYIRYGSTELVSDFDSHSSYDYGTSVRYYFTPSALDISQALTFYMSIDGVVQQGVPCTSDTRGYYTFPNNLSVDSHYCEAWVEDSNGNKSTALEFNLIIIDDTSLVVASDTKNPTVEEGLQLVLDYKVYMKNNISFITRTYVNNNLVNTGTCGLETAYYRTSSLEEGTHTIRIEVLNEGQTVSDSISWTVTVTPSEYRMLQPITTASLFIGSAMNRTNSDERRQYFIGQDQDENEILGTLYNFAYNNESGWVDDTLIISGNSYAEIPIQPLSDNARYGFTLDIEFLSKQIGVEDAEVLTLWNTDKNCGIRITTENLILRSAEGNECNLYFSDNEMTNVMFVIDRNEMKAKIYLNGVMCEAFHLSDYVANGISYLEDFTVNSNIILGGQNKNGYSEIKNLRVYQVALTTEEILNNFMANERDKTKQQQLVEFQKGNDLPTLTIYCDFSGLGKDDKKPCRIVYNSTDEVKYGKSFTLNHKNSTCQYQGTSSMAYPIKNYRINLADENGEKWRYDFPFGKPEYRYTLKADFMNSCHAHNTGLTKWVNDNLYNYNVNDEKSMNPKKWYDINNGGKLNDTRECIYGFPCRLILVNDGNSPLNEGQNEPTPGNTKDMGIFNFNHDKDATDTMGFDDDVFPNCASYEVTANSDTSAGAFMSYTTVNPSDMSELDYIKQSFEMRFPDEDDVSEGWGFMGVGEEGTGLKALIDWVDGCSDEEFVRDFEQHFHKDYTFRYYLLVITLGMVDNLGKNMMLDTWDNKIFMPRFYDCDTILSYDNSGDIKFDVDIEMEQGYWNTSSSRLWTRIRDLFHNELVEKYNDMRQNGLSYESLMKCFYDEQIAKIPQKYYNMDYDIKYAPFADSYIGMAHGDGYEHMKHWLKNRLIFTDTLFDYAPSYNNDMLTIRANTTEPMTIYIETYTPVYQHLSWYNGQMDKKKIDGKIAVSFTGTAMAATDQEVLIYGGSNVKKISGITSMNPNQMLIGSATRLTELIANDCPLLADINSNKANLSPHTYLNKVDLSNCPQLGGTLRLNNSQLIRDINIDGTIIDGLQLPPSLRNLEIFNTSENIANITLRDVPLLEELKIPTNIEYLSLINVPNLTTITSNTFSFDRLNTLIMENPTVNPISNIVSKAPNLQYVRLTGLNISCATSQIQSLLNMRGVDSFGNEIPIGQAVSGRIMLTQCSEDIERRLREQFPLVEFIVTSYAKSYTVTFVDGDGNVIYVTEVVENGEAIYAGDTPTKTSTTQYDFEWRGWNRQLRPITSNTTITATFNNVLRYYTVRFINSDTLEVLSSQYLGYGEMPVKPSLIGTDFNAWVPSIIETVTKDMDYYTQYIPYPDDISMFAFYKIRYNNIDGYACALNSSVSDIGYLIIPFQYNDLPVFMYSHSSGTLTASSVEEVYLPETITVLGDNAFRNFTNLKSINLSNITHFSYYYDYVTTTKNVSNVLYNCSSLISVSLPKLENLTTPAYGTYGLCSNCENLKYVYLGSSEYPITDFTGYYNGTTTYRHFYNSNDLIFINLITENGLESDVNFSYMHDTIKERLIYTKTPIELYSDNAYDYMIIENEATIIAYKEIATEIGIPSTVNDINITALGNNLFMNNSNITTVDMPNTITSLGNNCFNSCLNLASITGLNNVTSLGNSCFSGCSNLVSIDLPNVITLGYSCFYNCSNLIEIDLPNVTNLNQSVFYGCSDLVRVNLPLVTNISAQSFYECSSLVEIHLPRVQKIFGGLDSSTSSRTPFYNCTSLRRVWLGSKEYPFNSWTEYNLSHNYNSHFYVVGTNMLDFVNLITANGKREDVVFTGETPYADNYIRCTVTPIESYSDNTYDYIIMEDEATIISYKGFATEIEIPSTVNDINITALGNNVFYNLSITDRITSVNIPNTVTSLGNNCFRNCSSLASITGLNNVTSLGNSCFYNCLGLTSITDLDNVITLGGYCFYNCSSLTSIDLPNATTLDYHCFSDCLNLIEINLPNAITLGYDCFYQCSSLIEISLPNATTLGSYCFMYCTSLKTIILPKIIAIGDHMTSGCTRGVTVILGGLGNPIINTNKFTTYSIYSAVTNLIIYVMNPSNPPILVGSPWGATDATITYEQA